MYQLMGISFVKVNKILLLRIIHLNKITNKLILFIYVTNEQSLKQIFSMQ